MAFNKDARPNNQKPGSDMISLAKVFPRVIRRLENGDKGNFKQGKEEFLKRCPWFPAHFEKTRGEAFTTKIYNDMAGTVKKTQEKFKPSNWRDLQRKREIFCHVSARIHSAPAGAAFTEEEVENMIKSFGDPKPKKHPTHKYIQLVQLTDSPNKTKFSLATESMKAIARYKVCSGGVLWQKRYLFTAKQAADYDTEFQLILRQEYYTDPKGGREVYPIHWIALAVKFEAFLASKGITPLKIEFGENLRAEEAALNGQKGFVFPDDKAKGAAV